MITYFDRKNISESRLHSGKEKSFLDTIVFEDFSSLNCETREVLKEDYFEVEFDKNTIKMCTAIDKARGATGAKEAYGNHHCRLKGAWNGNELDTKKCVDIPLYVDKEEFHTKPKNMGKYKTNETKPVVDAILAFGAYSIKEIRNYYYDQSDENKQAIADKAAEFNTLDKSKQKEYLKKGKAMLKEK